MMEGDFVPNNYIRVLSIAGSDCSGGAGIQADLKTFTVLGCYGMSVITALTAQNTQGVQAIHPIPATFVAAQFDSVMQDIGAEAIKIGMLHNEQIILTIAERLQHYGCNNLVLDPVMVAKNGSLLLQENAIAALKQKLIPMTTLLTPNIPEAEKLLVRSITNRTDMQHAAKALCEFGCTAVLVKGGHLHEKNSADCLYIKASDEFQWFESQRIITKNTHGTGCTLSAAIAAFLAREFDLVKAIQHAKNYLIKAIHFGSEYNLGGGCGPVHHFWKINEINRKNKGMQRIKI